MTISPFYISSRIDDEVGASNIATKFARIYRSLYNQHDLGVGFVQLEREISEGLCERDVIDADRITVDIIKKALKQMKNKKKDALLDMQSDCLINGPTELLIHLRNLVRTGPF